MVDFDDGLKNCECGDAGELESGRGIVTKYGYLFIIRSKGDGEIILYLQIGEQT
jgi:hypothetical protein